MERGDDVFTAVEASATEFGLNGTSVVVAVSGGPDSLALLHALHRLKATSLVAAHFDHGLRGEQSAAEAAFVVDFCRSQGIPCRVETAAPGSIASSSAGSLQESARAARYAFLDRIADEVNADFIATAHNRDDQIETVLINILRGTGIDGLRGIPRRNGRIVRPLLDVPRTAIEAYCIEHSLSPRRDPTNDDSSHYLRNRIRLELLPMLVRDYHPGVRDALLRLSENAAIDSAYLDSQATHAYEAVAVDNGLDPSALTRLPLALRRRVVRLALEHLRGTREGIEERHVDLALDLAAGTRADAFTLGDIRIRRSGAILLFELQAPSSKPAPYSIPLTLNSTVELPSGWVITSSTETRRGEMEGIAPAIDYYNDNRHARNLARASDNERENATHTAAFDADRIDLPSLTVRTRLDGDRIDPLGMGGQTKKLQDLFVDAKVPKGERNQWPVIVDKNGPVWIPGLTQADRPKLMDSTVRKLYLIAPTRKVLLVPSPFQGEG